MPRTPWLWIALTVASMAVSPAARADTIFLKNGRVLRSATVRVVGERLVFTQYDGEVSIPLALVERIERDALSGPEAEPTPSPEEYAESLRERPGAAAGPTTATGGTEGGQTGAQEARAGGAVEAGPDTPEYWRTRLAEVEELIDGVEERLGRLPEYRSGDTRLVLDGRMLWVLQERQRLEQRLEGLDQLRRSILDSARRAGIPPGWLRR